MDLIYWQVRSFIRRGGDRVKEVDGGYFSQSCEYHFIRVRENVVQYPSNFISII